MDSSRKRKRKPNSRLGISQRKIMSAIDAYIVVHGYAPSHRDIAASLGWSDHRYVGRSLRRLRRLGLVSGREGVGRAVGVTGRGYRVLWEYAVQDGCNPRAMLGEPVRAWGELPEPGPATQADPQG
jgi:SOS-response transcriptional repressor LexA